MGHLLLPLLCTPFVAGEPFDDEQEDSYWRLQAGCSAGVGVGQATNIDHIHAMLFP